MTISFSLPVPFFGLVGLLVTQPALAALFLVEVDLPEGDPYTEALVYLHKPAEPGMVAETDFFKQQQWRQETRRGVTDHWGVLGFNAVGAGRYTVSMPVPPGVIQPLENPAQPAPVVTFFDDEEKLSQLIQLQYGTPVGVALQLPPVPPETLRLDYTVHFRHRATGFEMISKVKPQLPQTKRLLSEGTWDIWVDAPPGQLLVGLERDGKALPGHSAPLVFKAPKKPPLETWLNFVFTTTATIEGRVVVTGGTIQDLAVMATLAQPGEWYPSAEERRGSNYGPVIVPLQPDGRYRFDLPDGVWSIAPQSQRMLEVTPLPPLEDPPLVEVQPGEIAQADFEVELDASPPGTFRVRVKAPSGADLAGAVVQLTPVDDPDAVLRSGVTAWFGESQMAFTDLLNIVEGNYFLLVGHRDYLAAERELGSFRGDEVDEIIVELEAGAELYLQAVDLADHPAKGVEWTVRRLEPPLEVKLKDPSFVLSKTRRVAVTDDSGRARVPGLYGGTYRLRALRPPSGDPLIEDKNGERSGLGGLFHVGRTVGELAETVDVDLPDGGSAKAWARQLPGASLYFQLFCDDNGRLPPEVEFVLIDLDGPTGDMEAAKEASVLRGVKVDLFGPKRDSLLIGPVDQGAYRAAVRPATFTRWTWAFGTHNGGESYPIPIDIEENEPMALVDQGPLKIECGPAVDLVPELLEGKLPDLRQVGVQAAVLDLVEDRQIAASPKIERHAGRVELRGLPPGRWRLDFMLSHPHFLPHADLRWQIDLHSTRGHYAKLAPNIHALGGAVLIERYGDDRGRYVRVEGEGLEPFAAPVQGEPVLVPSLEPGVYKISLCTAAECAEPLEVWESVEVPRGVTTVLGKP